MPHEPKRRHSTQRKGKRRQSIKLTAISTIICPNCKEKTLAHSICKACGFYKGREIIKQKTAKK